MVDKVLTATLPKGATSYTISGMMKEVVVIEDGWLICTCWMDGDSPFKCRASLAFSLAVVPSP